MMNWPFSKRSAGLRVVLKLNSLSLQCWTAITRSVVYVAMPLPLQRHRVWRIGSLQIFLALETTELHLRYNRPA
jgi:hypothetical protein